MTNCPKVSIIFPNYNGGGEPIKCLKSIYSLNYPKDKIVTIVIDNHSTDGSYEEIKKKFPAVILIRNPQNLGFAKAINQGIKKAKGTYIFITNDDIVFGKDSLKNLIDFSLKNPQVGILGGKIFKKIPPGRISCAGNQMNLITGNVYSCPNPNQIKEPGWIPGCAMLVKRLVVNKIGLIDDLFTYSFDDYDYCLRAKAAGFKVVYLPTAKFWHRVSTTANKNRQLTHFQWYQSKLRFTLKYLPPASILSIFLFQTAIIPAEAIFKRDHRIIPYIKALIWNFQNLSKTLKVRKPMPLKWLI